MNNFILPKRNAHDPYDGEPDAINISLVTRLFKNNAEGQFGIIFFFTKENKGSWWYSEESDRNQEWDELTAST